MLLTVSMTSGKLYDSALNSAIEKYKASYLTPLSKYKMQPNIPGQLAELLTVEENVSRRLAELQSIRIPPLSFDPTSIVSEHYAQLKNQSEAQKAAIREKADKEKEALITQHNKEVVEAKEYNESLARPLQDKHQELLAYKDKLQSIFEYYDITPLDMSISDDLTRDEFKELIISSLEVCRKYDMEKSGIFDKVLSPVKENANLTFTLCYCVVAVLLIYFTLPFITVPVFFYVAKSIHNMYKDQEKLKIACSLMAQVDYNRFTPEEELRSVEEVNTTSIEENMHKELDSVKDYTVEENKALNELTKDSAEISKVCLQATQEVSLAYSETIGSLSTYLKSLRDKKAELLKDYKQFPEYINDSLVMSHDYVIGREKNTIDVKATLPLRNIVFDATNRTDAINRMKLYLANALLSVRVKQLSIEIFDPKNMGGDFSEFITPDTKDYIKINSMELGKLLSIYKGYTQENIIGLDKRTIDEFNKEAEEKELVPKEYKLLLLISEYKSLNEGESKESFQEFVKFSAEQGVMVWLLSTEKYPNCVWISSNYNMQGSPIQYDPSLGRKAVNTFAHALINYKDRGIGYVEKFGDVFIPREKWWTFDTIKGIKMPFGLENGDPTRGLNVAPVIGDANVHALLGGATGAGKSAAINQLLISLITMYPPSELQIVYIDFKNVEAAKFTAGYDRINKKWMDAEVEAELRQNGEYYNRLSRIPQLRIISGTTDGEYALSVFEFLMAEMQHRQEIINKFGVTKIQEMREQILAKYNKEHNGDPKKGTWAEMRKDWNWYKPNVYDKYGDLPRLLVIFDEFQVMYNPEFVEAKVIDMINGKITAITKLARAMAAHFWFTSQSMKGTMPADTMANFSLRGALRCTKEVSSELIGNEAAGTIKAKFGYMYTNDTAGQDKTANKLWRVPFLDEKKMPDYIDTLNEMLEEYNEKHLMAEFYDEKVLVPSSVLDEWYQQYDAFNDPHSFILGERANFSTNKAPVTLTLAQDTGENIMVSCFDREDLLNLVLTLVDNIKKKEDDCTLIMNVQDAETYTLLDVDNLVSDAFLPLASPKQDIPELINALGSMVDKRLEAGGQHKPVFVILVQWERADGIGSDINYSLQDKFKEIIRKAPTVGVHFIFAVKEKLDLPKMIPTACNHRIAGLIPKDSFFFIETSKVEKLPDHSKDAGIFAFYEFGTSLSKFRIYQHVFKNEIKSRDIVL